MEFHGNMSVGAELYHADGQRDMTKLFAVLRTCLKTFQVLLSFIHDRAILDSDALLLIGYIAIGRIFWGRHIPNVGNRCFLDEFGAHACVNILSILKIYLC